MGRPGDYSPESIAASEPPWWVWALVLLIVVAVVFGGAWMLTDILNLPPGCDCPAEAAP